MSEQDFARFARRKRSHAEADTAAKPAPSFVAVPVAGGGRPIVDEHGHAVDYLPKALGADAPGTERVFTSPHGRRVDDGNLRRRVLAPAAESAGVPWATFHTFRHTCASLLFAAGRDVKQVQEWLGHADPGFTLRTYVHLMDEGVGGADFLDAAVTVGEPRSSERVAA